MFSHESRIKSKNNFSPKSCKIKLDGIKNSYVRVIMKRL